MNIKVCMKINLENLTSRLKKDFTELKTGHSLKSKKNIINAFRGKILIKKSRFLVKLFVFVISISTLNELPGRMKIQVGSLKSKEHIINALEATL